MLLGGGEAALQKQRDAGMHRHQRLRRSPHTGGYQRPGRLWRNLISQHRDSMKMNNTICASNDGVVKAVLIEVGQSVGKDAPMIEFE